MRRWCPLGLPLSLSQKLSWLDPIRVELSIRLADVRADRVPLECTLTCLHALAATIDRGKFRLHS